MGGYNLGILNPIFIKFGGWMEGSQLKIAYEFAFLNYAGVILLLPKFLNCTNHESVGQTEKFELVQNLKSELKLAFSQFVPIPR